MKKEFSLEYDRKLQKHDLGPVEDDKETLRDKYAEDESAAERKEDFNKAKVNGVPDKGEDKIARNSNEGSKGKDINEFLVELKTQFRWRGLSPDLCESRRGKERALNVGFVNNIKLNLSCSHAFIRFAKNT